jgi:hypothetical protein
VYKAIHPRTNTASKRSAVSEAKRTVHKAVLWRIDEKGEVIWMTRLYDLPVQFALGAVADRNRTALLPRGPTLDWPTMIRGEDGTFILAAMATFPLEYADPYVIKFRDPDLIDVECPEPYTLLAATLLLPILLAKRRTRRTLPSILGIILLPALLRRR